MSTPGHWDVILNVGSAQTVLGIDFSGSKRREASFTELASKIGTRYRFLQAKLPPSGDECIGSWVEGARQDGSPMRAVLGRCVGGIYAGVIAEYISQWQREPELILLDPRFASTEFLGCELDKEISAVSCLMSDDEIKSARKIAREISDSRTWDVAQSAAYAIESYLDIITPAFERAGLGDARRSELNECFISYMTWLSAAGELDVSRALEKAIIVLSRDYAELPGRILFAANSGSSAYRYILCDVSHADLLRSDSVAKEVIDLLESR